MTHPTETTALPPPHPSRRRTWLARGLLAASLVGAVAAGAGVMRTVDRASPQAVMLLQTGPISGLREGAPAAIKGTVADVFGNTFVIADASGRTLVDTGPRGEGRPVVARDEPVTVQGRLDRGRLRAIVLVHADGRSESFAPAAPPPPPRRAEAAPPPPGAPDRDLPPPLRPAPDAGTPR